MTDCISVLNALRDCVNEPPRNKYTDYYDRQAYELAFEHVNDVMVKRGHSKRWSSCETQLKSIKNYILKGIISAKRACKNRSDFTDLAAYQSALEFIQNKIVEWEEAT
jgi:hypothetical protein